MLTLLGGLVSVRKTPYARCRMKPVVNKQVCVLATFVSLAAFCAGHLWRHHEPRTALAVSGMSLLLVLLAALIASRSARSDS